MAEYEEKIVRKQAQDESGATIVTKKTSTGGSDVAVSKVAQVIWFIVGVIVTLLLLRFVLSLLGANPANSFANLIYNLSDPLVSPFRGILQVGELTLGVARFEFETIVAMAVYCLFGWGLEKLVRLGQSDNAAS